MVKSITCGVRRVDGPEEEYVFDSRPISESILSICKGLKLPYDEEDNYHVLVAGNEATAPLVTTRAQLLEAKERGRTPLVVQRGSDLVKARLRVLQGTGDLNDRLSGLLVAVRGDAWLAEEVVAHNGIRVVVEVALTCAWRYVELAMTCLCEIFRNGHVNTWVKENAEEFTPKLFRQLFSVLFPLPHARAKQETKIPPHASLCVCIFLLQRLPGAARSAHAAAVGAGKFGDSAEAVHEAYYSPMLDAMDAEDDDFQRGAAESVLSAMAVAGAKDEQLRSAMQKELVVLAGRDSEVGGTAILSRCSDRSYFMERMLMTSMGACVELAMAYSRNAEQSKALENYRTIERRVERMHEVSENMKEQVRKQHQIMCRMVPFMQIESDPVVEPSLDGIIRFGWDSLHWKRGYSMLHYCAESVEDPAVVELIGLLATEVDKPDDDNMRPIDYARRSGREAIVRVIERLRRQRRDGEGKEEEPKGEVVNVEALRHRLEEMGDLPQELKKALEVQLDHCGSSIEWPSDFTAAHLAAKKGHVSALELLADAGAELATRDAWGLTPLDYAAQGQHESAILTIQRILADRNKPSPQPRLSGSSVDHAPSEGRGRSNSRLRRGAISGAAGANRRGAGDSEDDGGEMYFTTGEGEDAEDDNEAAEAEAASQPHVELFTSFEEPSPEDRAQMVIPEGLGPELQKSCEAVRRKGWAKIRWGATNFTALHLAAQCGSMEVVTFLLKASAAPSLLAEDHKNCTPLTWAVNKGHEEVASLLRAAQTAYEAHTAREVTADEPAEEVAQTPAAPQEEPAPPSGPTPEDSAETPVPPPAETKSTVSSTPGHAGISAGASSPAASSQRKSMAASMMGEASRTDGEHSEHWKNVRDVLRKSRATVAFTGQTSQDVLSSLGQHRRTRRGSEDFGMVELRQEVKKLSVEKHMWQEERAELLGRRGSAVKGVTLSETFDQSTLQNFVIQLETFGREAVISKLMRPTMTGGLALDQAGAKSVCDQLEMVMKCCEARSNRVKALGDALAGSLGAGPPPQSEQQPADAGKEEGSPDDPQPPKAGPKGKGKPPPPGGKGKAPPPPPTQGQAAEEEQTQQSAPPAKGPPPKGKGKGPPPPPGKGGGGGGEAAAAESQEPAAAAGSKGKGKGPPPPGGGKGPPPPGGGKGPPPPGGKGPAAPDGGGKGPGAPGGGKGPGAKGGKGGKGGVQPTKPEIKPGKAMKPLWWNRLLMGEKLKPGETVWDKVADDLGLVPKDDLEARFAKVATSSASSKPKASAKDKEGEEAAKQVKVLKIITDQNAIIQKETGLKQLPPATECARALEELDDALLSEEMVRIIKEVACPTQAELKQLKEARDKEPNIPMGLPEQYMWVIGNLTAYQMRADCWFWIRTYGDLQHMYYQALTDFLEVVKCFKESNELPSLLGLILAVGNYLNAGTSRGQADGFEIDVLGKLDTIKDGDGKDLRDFIYDIYFNSMTDKAAGLVDDLDPVFRNVKRTISKDSGGVEKLQKQPRVVFEDFDICVRDLAADFTKMKDTMAMVLSFIEDPADQFKLRMPREFERAEASITSLTELRDKAKQDYEDLLKWFKVQSMKSSDWCMLWDNLFVPGDLIINKDATIKTDYLVPTFCKGKPFTIDDLMVLWGFREYEEKTEEKSARGRRKKGRRKRDQEATAADDVDADPEERPAPPAADDAKGTVGKGKGKDTGKDGSKDPISKGSTTTKGKSGKSGEGKAKGALGKGKEPLPKGSVPEETEESPPQPSPAPAPAAGKAKGKVKGELSKGLAAQPTASSSATAVAAPRASVVGVPAVAAGTTAASPPTTGQRASVSAAVAAPLSTTTPASPTPGPRVSVVAAAVAAPATSAASTSPPPQASVPAAGPAPSSPQQEPSPPKPALPPLVHLR